MGEWRSFRLGEVSTKIGSGATPRGGSGVYLDHGPYSLIRSQNVFNEGFHTDGLASIGEVHAGELRNVEVLKDDILLNITGASVARCCQVDCSVLPARVNQHVSIIRPDSEKLDPQFLRYLLISPKMQAYLLARAGAGATREALTKEMIESLEVFAPDDVAEQRAIAHILGTLDDKIELNRRMNETLEAMARAIFKSWFVDFDPVRAKAAGRDPGLPKPIADLFPDRFESSVQGEIPAGWKVKNVGDIGAVICGKTPSTKVSEYFGVGIPFITIPDMHGKIFITETKRKLSKTGAASQPKKMLPAGSICVSCIATSGLVAITSEPSQTNQQINTVVPSQKDETYFWFWLLQNLGDEIRAHGSGGSVLTNLSTGRFSQLHALFPPADLRTLYHFLVTIFFNRILQNDHESRTLAALRDTLLPKLITDELRVKKAERSISQKAS